MTEFSCFMIGLIFGIIAMAFFVLIHSIGAQFREIEWHDAKLENPTEYMYDNPILGKCINVLVRYDNGTIHETFWSQEKNYYLAVPIECRVTHFAYLKEIEKTIPKNIK